MRRRRVQVSAGQRTGGWFLGESLCPGEIGIWIFGERSRSGEQGKALYFLFCGSLVRFLVDFLNKDIDGDGAEEGSAKGMGDDGRREEGGKEGFWKQGGYRTYSSAPHPRREGLISDTETS